jgi:hypothetical protein
LWLWWTDCKTEFILATVAYIILCWIYLQLEHCTIHL